MPDLIIKPAAQSGNKVIIQDQAGGAVITTADSGATIADGIALGTPASGVVTNLSGVLPAGVTGGSGLTALGTVATGNLSNSAIVYPAGHWNFIEKLTTMTGSGSSQYWTWTGATSTYNNYRFIFEDLLCTTSRGRIYMRVLNSGSPITSGYWWAHTNIRTTSATVTNGGTGQGQWLVTADNIGGGGVIYIDVIVMNLTPNATSSFSDSNAGIKWSGTVNGETYLESVTGAGAVNGANTNYNGVDINMGNFHSGQVAIFGQSKY
jgi:hypothetical protein